MDNLDFKYEVRTPIIDEAWEWLQCNGYVPDCDFIGCIDTRTGVSFWFKTNEIAVEFALTFGAY